MRKARVIEHYNQVYETEQARLSGLADSIDTTGSVGKNAHKQLVNLMARWRGPTWTNPRLTLSILTEVLGSLSASRGIGNSAPSLLGSLVMPLTGVMPSSSVISGTVSPNDVGSCASAETYYNEALSQLRQRRFRGQTQLSVYHTADRVPVLLRKKHDVSSALTLQSIALAGIEVPSGTIVAVDSANGRERTGSYITTRYQYATYEIDSPYVRPARISPWAYADKIDRALFGLTTDHQGEPHFDGYRVYYLAHRTIDDFREGAQKLMTMCGVEPAS